jgi:hypothetical protein
MSTVNNPLSTFIEQRGKQLAFFVLGFLDGSIPFRELHLFVDEVLQEWDWLEISQDQPYADKEPVFWHLLFTLERWPEQKLRGTWALRNQLRRCASYMNGSGIKPEHCHGTRP